MMIVNEDGAERMEGHKIFTREYTVLRFADTGNYGIIVNGWFPSAHILKGVGDCGTEWPTARAQEAMNRFRASGI